MTKMMTNVKKRHCWLKYSIELNQKYTNYSNNVIYFFLILFLFRHYFNTTTNISNFILIKFYSNELDHALNCSHKAYQLWKLFSFDAINSLFMLETTGKNTSQKFGSRHVCTSKLLQFESIFWAFKKKYL